MKYQGKKVAVLGAGLSGTAAALLLRKEGADVTVLDSAEERTLLKSTIENLRKHGVEVRCGAEADRDSSPYDFGCPESGDRSDHSIGEKFSLLEISRRWVNSISGGDPSKCL
jgi:UDP-N-acetylmuramoylalanine-D-glutamate ligase